MRKLYYSMLFLAMSGTVSAQSFLEELKDDNLKLKEIEARYREEQREERFNEINREEEGEIGEDDNYHMERWLWYWREHTDQAGYIVSPMRTFREYLKMQNRSRGKSTADQSSWVFEGPTTTTGGYRGIGRINCIEFHPTNKNIYWVGASGGGVWKTTNDGVSWTSVTHDLPRLDVSDFDVNPLNPNTMYICTGDRDGGSASYNNNNSIGVLKSYDGGNTWDTTAITWKTSQGRLTNCLVINSVDTNSIALATSSGIYKSYDGGATFNNVQSGHFKQVLYKPGDTSIMYATRYGNNNGQVYRSTDGGANWTSVYSPSGAQRITLAVTVADPTIVKGIVSRNDGGLHGIINSSNSGASFTQIYTRGSGNCNNMTGDLITGNMNGKGCGKQGWYDLSITISPTNKNEMYVGGVNTYHSNNGGNSWTLTNQWYSQLSGVVTVHADKHWLTFHPLQSNRLFECNDGGIYKTDAPQSTLWTNITNGMGITQFYRHAISDNATFVLCGAQDNGTKQWQKGVWDDVSGGDGMECQIDPLDTNIAYTGVQRGVIYRYQYGNQATISDNIPGQPEGAWITPYLIAPQNNSHLVAGYKHIYYTMNRGNTWISITGSEITGDNATRLAISNDALATIYAIFPDTSVVFYTKNYNPGTTANFDTLNIPYSGNVSDIKAHPTDKDHFYISFSGYGGTRLAQYDSGAWSRIDTNLPDVPVRCIEYDSSNNIMYVGTDLGVYYMDTITKRWEPWRKNMPFIEVTDLGINYSTNKIWATTYGRGLWSSDKQKYITAPDTSDTSDYITVIPYTEDVFSVAPNPTTGQFTIIATESIFNGQAVKVNVIDYTGKVVLSMQASPAATNRRLSVDARTLPAGAYIVELSNDHAVMGRKRLVIQ